MGHVAWAGRLPTLQPRGAGREEGPGGGTPQPGDGASGRRHRQEGLAWRGEGRCDRRVRSTDAAAGRGDRAAREVAGQLVCVRRDCRS